MSKFDTPDVRAFIRFAGEFSDDPRCANLKTILMIRPAVVDENAQIFLTACRTAVQAFNEQMFIVVDVDGVKGEGNSLGMSVKRQEKLASDAQQYLLDSLRLSFLPKKN